MVRGAKQRVVAYAAKEDGTYDPATGRAVAYDDGYQVSFVRPEAFAKLSDSDWDLLTAHIMKQTGSREHIGVYNGKAETSFRTATLEEAETLMRLFNQESILDWAKKKRYPDPKDWRKYCAKNEEFDENKEVDYDGIMRKIHKDHG